MNYKIPKTDDNEDQMDKCLNYSDTEEQMNQSLKIIKTGDLKYQNLNSTDIKEENNESQYLVPK